MKKTVYLLAILGILTFLFITGCTGKPSTKYSDAINDANRISAEAELKTVSTLQEQYKAENGTYTDDLEELRELGELPKDLTILEASEDSFKLRIIKNKKAYFYPEEKKEEK